MQETVPWVVMVAWANAVTPPATCLLRRRGVRNEILEAGTDAFVADGRGVRDVARNVLQREGLRLQAAYRGVKRVEDTHNIVSTFDTGGWPLAVAAIRRDCRKRYAKMENAFISDT